MIRSRICFLMCFSTTSISVFAIFEHGKGMPRQAFKTCYAWWKQIREEAWIPPQALVVVTHWGF